LTVEEALKIANKDRSSCVLGGERNAVKIGGFDFSNSPLEYKDKLIKGKKLVMTTTNGTRAIKRSVLAKNILIGAMINASAVSKKVIELNNDVVIVNSGTYR
jgi:2-phosphosulfolactate phosphatase